MTKLIEREKAIDAILSVDVYGDGQSYEALTHASVEVSLLPVIEAEHVKHGKWITDSIERNSSGVRPYYLFCSECHHSQRHTSNYCPKCGAKMDGEEE